MEMTSGQRPRVAAANTTEDRFGKLAIGDGQAAARQSSPSALTRLLAGALGSIARKAMRKEPELRYGSAQAMAEDIQAWCRGLPVDARAEEGRAGKESVSTGRTGGSRCT